MLRNRAPMRHALYAASLAALIAPLGPHAASATNVGVAAAVNPDALSHLSGVTRHISIGKDILFRERIATSQKGLVQVLFLDGSTITVGPGSDLVIDKFVYDPNKGTGELAASFSKGVLRFVGGKLSKQEGAVKFDTPVGTLGIRGGMFQGSVGDGEGNFAFLFGEEMTFTGQNGQTNRVFQPNNTLHVGGNGQTIRPTRPEDAQFFIQALSGTGGPGGGGTGTNDEQFQSSGIGGANSGSGSNLGGGLEQLFTLFNTSDHDENENEHTTTDVIREFVQNQNNNTTNPPPPGTDNPGNGGDGPGGVDNELPEPRPGFDQFAGFTAGFVGSVSEQDENSDINLRPILSRSTADFLLEIEKQKQSETDYAEEYGHRDVYVDLSVYDPPFGNGSTEYSESFAGFSYDDWIVAFPFEEVSEDFREPSVESRFGTNQPYEGTYHTGILFGAGGSTFCEACDFLKWGAWLTKDVIYSDNQLVESKVRGGLWIAGDITANTELPTTGSATYNGVAKGLASNRIGNQLEPPHVAQGDMNMEWHFGSRTGDLHISNFDGRDFGGQMSAPGNINQFTGDLSGNKGLSGAATGAFVNGGDKKAGGVIGNFDVGDQNWKANGVFGGKQTSFTPGE